MKAFGKCVGCHQEHPLEPFTLLCVECLIKKAKAVEKPTVPLPFDAKLKAAGKDE